MGLIERLEATIHKINGHWWNKRKRPEAPDVRAAIDRLQAMESTLREAKATLEKGCAGSTLQMTGAISEALMKIESTLSKNEGPPKSGT